MPLLELTGDGAVHTLSGSVGPLADRLGLSDADRAEMLGSGRSPRFANRVHWARLHLKAAGLLESAGRGEFRITPEGERALAARPESLTIKDLDRYPTYVEFRTRKPSRGGEVDSDPQPDDLTPEEMLERGHEMLRRSLADELLDRIKRSSSRFFEELVVDLLVAMGYGGSREDAGEAVGQTGDGGIDGVIREDKLGLDVIYLQAKRWERSVGRPTVQAFAGSLEGVGAHKGVLITTSTYTADAKAYVEKIRTKIVLIDGEYLTHLMIDHGVGVAPHAVYTSQRLDEEYFEAGLANTVLPRDEGAEEAVPA